MAQIQAFGKSREEYIFNIHLMGSRFNSIPGIYEFIYLSKNTASSLIPMWNVLYIGETENFRDRVDINLKQHHKYEYAIRNRATHIALFNFYGTDQQRKWIESDLIASYDPPGNKKL